MVRFILFIVSVVGGFFLAQFVGTQFLVNIMAQCQGMLQTFTIGAGIIVLVFGLIFMLREMFGLDDSLIGMVFSIVGGAVATAVLPILLVLTVGQLAPVKAVFCFDCAPPKKGAELIENKDFTGARVLLENFLKDEETRLASMPAETPDALKEQAQGCVGDAEVQLAQAYFELAAAPITALNELQSPGSDDEITSCQAKVTEAETLLGDAKKLAEKHGLKSLLSAIDVQSQRLRDAADKCKPTVLLKAENVKASREALTFVLRAQKRLDAADVPVEDATGDLIVRAEDSSLDASITEHKQDEQVCMLLLSDSSGSVGKQGLEQVRVAVDQLNTYRKPADYYGLLAFSGKESMKLVDMTSLEPIDRDALNINGKSTYIWDAVDTGLQSMSSCKPEITRRTLVLLTDGKDNGSAFMQETKDESEKAKALNATATAANIDLCVIAVTAGAKESKDSSRALTELATGCGFHYVDDFEGLSAEFADIFGISGHYYSVSVPGTKVGRKDDVQVCYTPADVCTAIDIPESQD
jgi:Mg-chelatase subunit ChlD